MKFTVEKTLAAEAEINVLEQFQKEIFEIKSNELRSLFKYKAGAIIVIGVVFVKKTQKTPKEKIKLAIKRLKEV